MGQGTAKILWSDQTIPQKAMNETLYALTFEFEVVILLEVNLPIIQTKAYDISHNEEFLTRNLDLADERRENALIRMVDY